MVSEAGIESCIAAGVGDVCELLAAAVVAVGEGAQRTISTIGPSLCNGPRKNLNDYMPVTAAGNAAEGIPRGNIRGGRDPLAGGPRTEMHHYTAHVTWPRRLAAPVTARSGMFWWCGATIFKGI